MTRIDVEGVGYAEASHLLHDANQWAAYYLDRLSDGLASSGSMAGDSSFATDFAISYDDAAKVTVEAWDDVVLSLANLGRYSYMSLENHTRAEFASTPSSPYPPMLDPDDWLTACYGSPPASLGGDPTSLPGWANAILDHIEGFIWPDADLDKLRGTATVWRTAAEHLTVVAGFAGRAVDGLWREHSPEIAVATSAITDLAGAIRDLGDQCQDLATSCEGYAQAVEEQRAAILDLVSTLLRDAILIQAAGFLVGLVSVGAANGAAAALNAAKLAAEAPKFIRMLEIVRAYSASASLTLNATATSVVSVQVRLSRFVKARLALRNDVGTIRLLREKPPLTWLQRHEGGAMGAHTLRTHVGKTDDFLRRRLLNEPGKQMVSTFRDDVVAERAVRGVLTKHSDDVLKWLKGPGDKGLALEGHSVEQLGRIMSRAGETYPAHTTRLVLIKDPSMSEGYRLLTAYVKP